MRPLVAVPSIALLVYRAYSRRSLTPIGILTAFLTAIAHAIHPWSVFFALLTTFFLAGTAATKVKHAQKVKLTMSSAGEHGAGPPSPRTARQVMANSVCASVLAVAHTVVLYQTGKSGDVCLVEPGARSSLADLLPYGIFAQYAAVAADTFASELGILAQEQPVLVTDVMALLSFKPKRVPRGTNGGVTTLGTIAGLGGAALMAVTVVILTPFGGGWTYADKLLVVIVMTVWGGLGSLLDSILGGLLQASVVDAKTGRVVEGEGGLRVSYRQSAGQTHERKLVTGQDILDNNGVNAVMAGNMTVGALVLLSLF